MMDRGWILTCFWQGAGASTSMMDCLWPCALDLLGLLAPGRWDEEEGRRSGDRCSSRPRRPDELVGVIPRAVILAVMHDFYP